MEETLGQYLRRKRESHLISIQEISHSTGISVPMITALEEDKFHLILRPDLTTQYLKRYAACVNLDKKDILNRYRMQYDRNQHQGYSIPHLSIFFEGEEHHKTKKGHGRFSKKQIIEGVFWAGIVIWAFVLLYLYIHVVSLKKTGMFKIEEIMPFKETRQEVSVLGSDPAPSPASRKNGNVPEISSREPSPGIAPVSLEHPSDLKGLDTQKSVTLKVPRKAKVIGNRKSKLYHMPGMKYYQKVRSQNRIVFFSEEEAVTAGYRKAPE